jgi:hypothetical protein
VTLVALAGTADVHHGPNGLAGAGCEDRGTTAVWIEAALAPRAVHASTCTS